MAYLSPQDFGEYFEHDIRYRWLRPHTLQDKLAKYKSDIALDWSLLGESEEGREIWAFKWGSGATKIALWTQMHGNESTATMAVVDLLNFFTGTKGLHKDLRKQLESSLCVHGILMLNPDGAEAFDRRNALGIDLNRDAVAQQSVEIKLFYKWLDNVKPDWCFNLHDQRNIFRPQGLNQTATISFLAPSPDVDRSMSATRERSMKLISLMYKAVKPIAGEAARYTDEYYPTALGDNLMKSGYSNILIESGAAIDDPLRDKARQFCFLSLIEAFGVIAEDKLTEGDVEVYNSIPLNDTKMLDVLIKNCEVQSGGRTFYADVGLLIKQLPNFNENKLIDQYQVVEFGDLSAFTGIKTLNNGVLKSNAHLNINIAADFIWKGANEQLQFDKGTLK